MKAYVCLSHKVGSYSAIVDRLLDLHIPPMDIFLLFGSIDMLIQFPELKSLPEFIETWFDPIRRIGADEGLITETLTLLVIREGPKWVGEPFAFIFLNTSTPQLEEVQKALLTVPGVLSADSVFGPYDIICPINVEDRVDLERIVSHIQSDIPSVKKTTTALASFYSLTRV